MQENTKGNAVNSLLWKTLERFGFHGIKLFVSVVLARLLCPDDFGVLGIVLVFVDFATILVQSGLNTSLIQAKKAGDTEFSSILWLSLGIATVLYILLFFSSPLIASYYNNPNLTAYLRVFGLILFGGSFNSIQIAYASRRFDFKSQFAANICAVVISGTVSVIMAYRGFGIWALIVQQLIWQYVSCFVMLFFIRWVPKFTFDLRSVIPLFRFGWKMLLSSLLIKVNTMISNLVVGKRFSTETLGYYSKAANFPTAFSDVAVNSISSVALVSFSKQQDDIAIAKKNLMKYIRYSMFFIAPIMAGLAAVSEAFIIVLLTEKWLPAAVYLQIFCCLYLFQPVCAIFGQAISGMGRSDLYLRTFLIVKPIGLLLIAVVSLVSQSALYVAIATVASSFLETLVQGKNVKKIFDISYFKLFRAWFPSVASAALMFVIVYFAGKVIPFSSFLKLCIQVVIGVVSYIVIVFFTDRKICREMVRMISSKLHGGKK